MNDENELSALARAAGDGNEAAREALVRTLWPNAYRIAWSILGDRGRAEDAAQAACTTICLKLSSLDDPQAFTAWAYRIIVSRSRDHSRSQRRLRLRETTDFDETAFTASHDDPSERLDLESAIARLPEHLRLVLELHYFIGLSSREVAKALGIPSATVRFRLAVARRRLRPLLTESITPSPTAEVAS